MTRARRIAIRIESWARQLALFAFWLRNGYMPMRAWSTAGRTCEPRKPLHQVVVRT